MKRSCRSQKKLRWNISKAMGVVVEKLIDSELKFDRTADYRKAVERISNLYGLSSEEQVWILCLSCAISFEEDNILALVDISKRVGIPAIVLAGWKNDIKELVRNGFLKWHIEGSLFSPVKNLMQSIEDNTYFVPEDEDNFDEKDFLNYVEQIIESDMKSKDMLDGLIDLESNHTDMEMIMRVQQAVKDTFSRFVFYNVASHLLHDDSSPSIFDIIWGLCDDESDLKSVMFNMLENRQELSRKGLVVCEMKWDDSDMFIKLSDKGKVLVFGDAASEFEDSSEIETKNIIDVDSIKAKKIYYSLHNEKIINDIKRALKDDNLNDIQQKLESAGLPLGICILFYGGPGTGKTESVLQIARESGRSIIHVDISSTKSSWFGESEKKIKGIFSSYENACKNAVNKGGKIPILFFNEADAIISKRTTSSFTDTCKTENAMQAILLEELEKIKGIFFATTNIVENLDSAFERRFLYKVKFENPTVEAKTAMWKDRLPWLNEVDAKKIAAEYDLSGGQIDNIARKIIVSECVSGVMPTVEEIKSMCRLEKIQYDGEVREIGFTA